MNTTISSAFSASLMKLKAAGDRSFEELMGLALTALTGEPFWRSGSGTQDGIDSRSLSGVAFECKRYKVPPKADDLTAKIGRCGLRKDVDLFVLCTTSEVLEQVETTARETCDSFALEFLVLDWKATAKIPSIAAAIAAIPDDDLASFLATTALSRLQQDSIRAGARHFHGLPGCTAEVERIKEALDLPTLSFSTSRKANAAWLERVFADGDVARDHLGQVLSPADKTVNVRPRPYLTDQLAAHMKADTDEGLTRFVIGQEGVGKSWAIASAWLALAPSERPLLLFATADHFAGEVRVSLADIVRELLPLQSDFPANPASRGRWERKVERWLTTRPDNERLAIVFDGINQQPDAPWADHVRLIDRALRGGKGCLLVSSRADYFSRLKSRLMPMTAPLVVPEWSEQEARDILRGRQLDPATLQPRVFDALRNPRLMSVAISLMTSAELKALGDLSIPHLLVRHIEATARNTSNALDPATFHRKLKAHAKRLVEQKAQQKDHVLDRFDDKVEDSAFYQGIPGAADFAELTVFGRRVALGLLITEQLALAHHHGRSLPGVMHEIVDPVAALDATSTLLAAAAVIAFLNEDVPGTVRTVIIRSFFRMQNPVAGDAETVAGIAVRDPDVLLDVLEAGIGERDSIGRGRVRECLSALSGRVAVDDAVTSRVKRWFTTFHDPQARAAERLPPVSRGHAVRSAPVRPQEVPLTPFEATMSLQIRVVDESRSEYHAEAARLIAGFPLARHVEALSMHAFAIAWLYESRKILPPLNDVVSHNIVDWEATRHAIDEFQSAWHTRGIGMVGQQALAHLLRMAGDSPGADVADSVLGIPAKAPTAFTASDPDALPPSEDLIKAFGAINIGDVFRSKSTRDAHEFDRLIDVMARFRPDLASLMVNALADCVIQQRDLRCHALELLAVHALLLGEEQLTSLGQLNIALAREGDEAMSDDPIEANRLCFLITSGRDTALLDRAEVLIENAPIPPKWALPALLAGAAGWSDVPYIAPEIIGTLPSWPDDDTRQAVLAVLATRGTAPQLDALMASGWHPEKENLFDAAYFGSVALYRAAMSHGQLDVASARILPTVLGEAAKDDENACTCLVDAVIRWTDELTASGEPLHLYSIRSTFAPCPTGPAAALSAESRLVLQCERMAADLAVITGAPDEPSHLGVPTLLPSMLLQAIESKPALAQFLGERLASLSAARDGRLQVFALPVSLALATISGDSGGVAMWAADRTEGNHELPEIDRRSITRMIWDTASEGLVDLQVNRLESAMSDFELLTECAAAQLGGNEHIVDTYAHTLLASEVPARKARALTLLGYLTPDAARHAIVKGAAGNGLPGAARRAAEAIMDRPRWGSYWTTREAESASREQRWAAGSLRADALKGTAAEWVAAQTVESATLPGGHAMKRIAIAERMSRVSDTLYGSPMPEGSIIGSLVAPNSIRLFDP